MQIAPQAEHMKEIDDLSINRDKARYWAKLPVEQRINNSQGYLGFPNTIPPQYDIPFEKESSPGAKWGSPERQTIRWEAAPNVRNLRAVYAAFKVPFPEHLMENGGIKWR